MIERHSRRVSILRIRVRDKFSRITIQTRHSRKFPAIWYMEETNKNETRTLTWRMKHDQKTKGKQVCGGWGVGGGG